MRKARTLCAFCSFTNILFKLRISTAVKILVGNTQLIQNNTFINIFGKQIPTHRLINFT